MNILYYAYFDGIETVTIQLFQRSAMWGGDFDHVDDVATIHVVEGADPVDEAYGWGWEPVPGVVAVADTGTWEVRRA